MQEFLSIDVMTAFVKVVLIDIALAGDNAIVIAMAAAGLPPELRKKAIIIGIATAAFMRIAFASVAVQLLNVVGLTLAGGLLLLWVSWKLWRELRDGEAEDDSPSGEPKSLRDAVIQIMIADISMSLDNVLAVAGAAREHPVVLVIGLVLSIALMGLAAGFIARLLQRHRWIAYVGLAIIFYVSVEMILSGGYETWGVAARMF